MIKLGLNTWLWAVTFGEKDLYCIDKIAKLGAEAIDFSVNDPFSFPVEKAKEKLDQYNMTPIVTTAMAKPYNAISPDTKERESALTYMKKLLDVAHYMGADIVGGVNYVASGYLTGKPRTRQEIDWDVEYLKMASDYAAKYGITIALEAIKRFESHFLNRAEQALELIDLVGADNIKVHLDTFHMNIEEDDIPGAIRLCGDKLAYMHLVDSNRGTPGMGHIPWVDVFKALKDINYEGTGCVETFNPQLLDEVAPLTYLTRRFADTPEELAEKGLRYLKAVRTMIYNV